MGTNPFDIPDGYCEIKHAKLSRTIARDGEINIGRDMRVMACHHSIPGQDEYCVGWLNHQLGVGNNIGLRMKMRECENISDMEVYGDQHEKFEDTLPK